MTNTDQTPAAASEKQKREKTSDRLWLDAQGNEVHEEKAVKGRYTLTLAGHTGSVEFEPKTSDPATRMCAIFGWLTRAGNIVNTWKHEKGDKAASPVDEINSWMALMSDPQNPVWLDRTPGAVGAKVDRQVLARAVIEVSAAAGRTDLDEAAVWQKLVENDDFFKTVRAVPAISAKYAELVGRSTKSLDDVLGAL
jgi:hypothetical protein